MSEDRSNGDNNNDVFANNRGVVKSWKSLVLIIVGFFGFIFAMTAFSAIPSLKWLTPALFGLLFFVVGIVFLKMSKTSYNLPLIAMLIGTLLMYIAIFDKYFPDIRDTIGDRSGYCYPCGNAFLKRREKPPLKDIPSYISVHISGQGIHSY